MEGPAAHRGGHPSGPWPPRSQLSDRHPCSAMLAIRDRESLALTSVALVATLRGRGRQPVVAVLAGTYVTQGL